MAASTEPGVQLNLVDRFTASHDAAQKSAVTWACAPGEEWVLRGSGIEVFRAGQKTLEITWLASTPLAVQWHEPVVAEFGADVGAPYAHGYVEITLLEGSGEIRTSIRTSDFFYRDWGLTPGAAGWQQHRGEVPVNYFLDEFPGATHAVLVFSALGPRGSFTYNYKRSLDALPAHKIYVLDDFGDQGAYFHSHSRNLAIHRSVLAALQQALNSLNVPLERTHAVGSSKGGTAALMFGAELGVANIIVGAPQVKIGSFLKTPHPNILRFMAGDHTEQSVKWADEILTEYIQQLTDNTSVTVVIGDRDHHYRDHLPVLLDFFDAAGRSRPAVKVLPGIDHASIGKPYAELLPRLLEEVMGLTETVSYFLQGWDFEVLMQFDRVEVTLSSPSDGSQAAIYLMESNVATQKIPYSSESRRLEFFLAVGEKSRLRFYVKKGDQREALSTSVLSGTP
ncbi:hypothetical protein [Kocuria sp.]|uniref:hypothetical protein n=1 Tax=Kocuria sp. TaxID=1871328 RepID=UPI0026E0F3ED|nr:hypothetical protein [Kocuria sp.]